VKSTHPSRVGRNTDNTNGGYETKRTKHANEVSRNVLDKNRVSIRPRKGKIAMKSKGTSKGTMEEN